MKDIENPWLNAKRQWNEHEGAIVTARKMWQAVALISLLIALCSISGMIYTANQSKFIPYVVQVDKLGSAVATRPAYRMEGISDLVMKSTLAGWIADCRLVSADKAVQRDSVFRVYSHLNNSDPATVKITQYLNPSGGETPFDRAAKETVHAEITSAIAMSKDTWQVDWIEHIVLRDGKPKSSLRWRAMLTIKIVPPSADMEEEQLRRNPLGIYISDVTWTRQL